jgi:hypothetical protein
MTRSAFATSASRASASVTSSEIGRAFFRPEASFRALSRVRHAKLCQSKRSHGSLTVHTNYDLDARIREDLGSWLGHEAGSKKQCFLRMTQLGLDSCDHGRHISGLICCNRYGCCVRQCVEMVPC